MSRRLLPAVAAACAILALTSPAAHATRPAGRPRSCRSATRSSPARRAAGRATRSSAPRTGRARTGPGRGPATTPAASTAPSDATGCHRSDVAEVQSTTTSLQTKANLACSGAVTANIFRPSNGGQAQKGEANQAEKLQLRRAGRQREGGRAVDRRQRPRVRRHHRRLWRGLRRARPGPAIPSQQQVVNARRSAAFNGRGQGDPRGARGHGCRRLPRRRLALHRAELRLAGAAGRRGALLGARPAARDHRRLPVLRRRPQLGA